ncbi:MAG: polymerase sigma-B factor, partial [Acidobacteriaceae bacterium]|nr:polymerase sigma-B factor [Acidobacteriaceae bacterium]
MLRKRRRDALIEQWLPLAFRIAFRWWSVHGGDLDNLRGEAQLALVRASRRFDPRRGYSFGTFAGKYVWTALYHLTAQERRHCLAAHPLVNLDVPDRETTEVPGLSA